MSGIAICMKKSLVFNKLSFIESVSKMALVNKTTSLPTVQILLQSFISTNALGILTF